MAGCSVGHHTCQVLADAVGRVALRRALPPPLLDVHAPALLEQLAALRVLVHLQQAVPGLAYILGLGFFKGSPIQHPCRRQHHQTQHLAVQP